jgi:murein L,D-transpeptidase YcbB/YkuD
VQKISDAIDAGDTAYLPLAKRLPVYFLYWTAFADESGATNFRPDIYGRDQRMINAGRTRRVAASLPNCARG